MCLYSINVFFGTYLTYIEKKSEGLSRYMFILFFFIFSETKKTSTSVRLRENLDLTKEIMSKVLNDMISLVSKTTTEPLLSTREKNSSGTGKGGQNRTEQYPAI